VGKTFSKNPELKPYFNHMLCFLYKQIITHDQKSAVDSYLRQLTLPRPAGFADFAPKKQIACGFV